MKKTRKAISAPLGVIFGVLLAIILVVLATFIAFNISTTAVKSQGGQLVIVGQPVAFVSSNGLEKITIVVKNPTGNDISLQGFIYNGNTYNFADQLTVGAGTTATLTIQWSSSASEYDVTLDSQSTTISGVTSQIDVADTDAAQGYMEIVLITDRGTVTVPLQIVQVS